jgi:hypothetical protein
VRLWLAIVHETLNPSPERHCLGEDRQFGGVLLPGYNDYEFPKDLKPSDEFLVMDLPGNLFSASARTIEILAESRPLSKTVQSERTGQSDRKPDKKKKSQKKVPDNDDVSRLALLIGRAWKRAPTAEPDRTKIAREFVREKYPHLPESDVNKSVANLTRQLRPDRFGHLIKRPDSGQ